jgi:hypothetical protein
MSITSYDGTWIFIPNLFLGYFYRLILLHMGTLYVHVKGFDSNYKFYRFPHMSIYRITEGILTDSFLYNKITYRLTRKII